MATHVGGINSSTKVASGCFGTFLGVWRSLEMILSRMALSCCNMSPSRAIWTNLTPNPMDFQSFSYSRPFWGCFFFWKCPLSVFKMFLWKMVPGTSGSPLWHNWGTHEVQYDPLPPGPSHKGMTYSTMPRGTLACLSALQQSSPLHGTITRVWVGQAHSSLAAMQWPPHQLNSKHRRTNCIFSNFRPPMEKMFEMAWKRVRRIFSY